MAQGAIEIIKASGVPIPLALHLDHGDSYELAVSCIETGFSSVMIDGSSLPYEKNVELTRKVVEALLQTKARHSEIRWMNLQLRTASCIWETRRLTTSAFRASNVSIGVMHRESPVRALDCDYIVKFELVPDFLYALVSNDFLFTPDFPMIKINPRRRRK
jgi:hypothetical protein